MGVSLMKRKRWEWCFMIRGRRSELNSEGNPSTPACCLVFSPNFSLFPEAALLPATLSQDPASHLLV